jgi:hypothetical protein
MKKNAFLFVVATLFLGNVFPLSAQIVNGTFSTGDLTGWTVVGGSSGGPQVVTSNPLSTEDGTAALVQSTSGDLSLSLSASAATLNAALGVSLPSTYDGNILDPSWGQSFPAVNGQAIYQTFTLTSEATLSFSYSYQTNDYYPYDAVGYVLDGNTSRTYTSLVTTPAYTGTVNSIPTAYLSVQTLTLSPGTYTLGFVAYNTGGHGDSTSLYVTDISTTPVLPEQVPEPGEGTLILLGVVGLIIVRIKMLRLAFSS